MIQKIPLYQYVAYNNPSGAANIIAKFNLGKPENYNDLARGLKHIMATKGEEGFIEIAKQHPDRKLILDVEALTTPTPITIPTQNKSNCGGCSSFSGFDGPTTTASTTVEKETTQFATKYDLDKYNTQKKLDDLEKKLTKEDISNEIKNVLNKSNNFITDNLPTIAIIAGVAFLYVQLKK